MNRTVLSPLWLLLVAAIILAMAEGAHAGPMPPTASRPPKPAAPAVAMGTTSIGESVEGRHLVVHRFGDGPRTRMIVAGIHGGYEWNTVALASKMIEFLEARPQVVPPDLTLFVLPNLNPDGEARSHGYEGRANANGVDLNRNFPSNWQAEWATAGCWAYLPIGGGDHPLSEPETRALVRFILGEHVEALISYHSAALGIFAGGRPSPPGSLALAEAVAAVTDYQYPPRETGCQYTGQFTDWAADNGISAVDVELSTHYSLDVEQNLRVLLAFLTWQPPTD